MKKLVMLFVVMALAMGLYAEQITTTMTSGVAQVINTGPTQLFKVIPMGGGVGNTSAARTILFYDNVSVRVSDHPHTDLAAFTWRFEIGQFSTDVPPLDLGYIYNKWGYDVTEGKNFSAGLVVSPTASEKLIIQFVDK